jgi:hypothetical protein
MGDINVTRIKTRRRRASVIYNNKMFWSSNRLRLFIQWNEYVYYDARYRTNTIIIILDLWRQRDFMIPSLFQFPTWYAQAYVYTHEDFLDVLMIIHIYENKYKTTKIYFWYNGIQDRTIESKNYWWSIFMDNRICCS